MAACLERPQVATRIEGAFATTAASQRVQGEIDREALRDAAEVDPQRAFEERFATVFAQADVSPVA